MGRLLTFLAIGPFLVWLTFLLTLVPQMIRVPPGGGVLTFFLMMLVAVLFVGLLPSLVLAGIDHQMAKRAVPPIPRALICAALGYPAALLAFWVTINEVGLRSSFADDVFIAGLYGIIPAAVCSWLAGRNDVKKGSVSWS